MHISKLSRFHCGPLRSVTLMHHSFNVIWSSITKTSFTHRSWRVFPETNLTLTKGFFRAFKPGFVEFELKYCSRQDAGQRLKIEGKEAESKFEIQNLNF